MECPQFTQERAKLMEVFAKMGITMSVVTVLGRFENPQTGKLIVPEVVLSELMKETGAFLQHIYNCCKY
jgi:hypothetical protein